MIEASKVVLLIIHLERAKERRAQIEKIAASTAFDSEIVRAVDGATLDLPETRIARQRPFYPFELQRTEIACFESHRRAWKRIADGDQDFGLVVEDDAEFDGPSFSRALKLVMANATVYDFVRFPIKVREKPGEVVDSDGDTKLIRPSAVAVSCVCQLVGREAARRLLAASVEIDRPVDAFIQLTWITGVKPLTVMPSGVSEISASLGGTIIHKGKQTRSFWSIARREVARLFYRGRLRLSVLKNR